jgi:hypothetical protein
MKLIASSLCTATFTAALLYPSIGSAQEAPQRSAAWGTASTVTAVTAVASSVLMPRVFYAEPEVTAGWKARWHVSVLAPTLTQLSLTMANEYLLKDAFQGYRPGCNDGNFGSKNCESYGMMSSHSFLAGSSFGQGLAIFLVDTFKWSNNEVNLGSLVGHVGVPLVLGSFTTVGRYAGEYETGGQVLTGTGIGMATGLLMGLTYATLQRPSCGYGGSLICW